MKKTHWMRWTLLLIMVSLLVPTTTFPHIAHAAQSDIPAPLGSESFGESIVVLKNGNIVITDPNYDDGMMNVGAVYLYRPDLTLISVLKGSHPNDRVGSGFVSVVALDTSNFIVISPDWNEKRGAVTLIDGTTGLNGTVSVDNSLIGSQPNDYVAGSPNPITVFKDGSFAVRSESWSNSRGAATWVNPKNGTNVKGIISESNSLVGSKDHDGVPTFITQLPNGNYVVSSLGWNDGRGAVTWIDGTSATITGIVTTTNSLVGSKPNDWVGQKITVLANGNYTVDSKYWNNNRGAVTWANANVATTGVVSSSNSLVGNGQGIKIGEEVIALANGNYIVPSSKLDGYNVASGSTHKPTGGYYTSTYAVAWGDGTYGVSGVISEKNAIVGSPAPYEYWHKGLGVALPNGNYVVNFPFWNNNRGAVRWVDGTIGATGFISSYNALVGTQPNDFVGHGGITALANGNYVVNSPIWNNKRGAVTWLNGTMATTDTVSDSNSLVGSQLDDTVGFESIALDNGNYVVTSPMWWQSRGAVTWLDGSHSMSAVVSSTNSLIGKYPYDSIGGSSYYMRALSSGNYVVNSQQWHDDLGATTWGSGITPTIGVVDELNSLVGVDRIRHSRLYLTANGNYVVSRRGEGAITGNVSQITQWTVTLGSGTTPTSGSINTTNSLIGKDWNSLPPEILPLSDGSYLILVGSPTAYTSQYSVIWADVDGTALNSPVDTYYFRNSSYAFDPLTDRVFLRVQNAVHIIQRFGFASPAPNEASYGLPFNHSFNIANGTGITYSITGDLPLGLEWHNNVLSGIPLQVGDYPLQVTASNGVKTKTQTFTLKIKPADLTVQLNHQTRAYGSPNSMLAYTVTGLVNQDTAAMVLSGAPTTTATITSNVGIYPINQGTLTSSVNYKLHVISSTLDVTPAPLIIKANDQRWIIGQAQPTFTVTFDGFVNSETTTALSGTLTLTTSASVGSPAGHYPIIPAGLSSNNYAIEYEQGVLDVLHGLYIPLIVR